MTNFTWLEEIDHTGDCGVCITAESEAQLFARAALAMMHIITDITCVSAQEKTLFSLEAADRAALLRKWLNQLNYYHITEEFLFCDFKIREIAETRLIGAALGEKIDTGKHQIFTEIKAVTYHELEIEQTSMGWSAQIIFDL